MAKVKRKIGRRRAERFAELVYEALGDDPVALAALTAIVHLMVGRSRANRR